MFPARINNALIVCSSRAICFYRSNDCGLVYKHSFCELLSKLDVVLFIFRILVTDINDWYSIPYLFTQNVDLSSWVSYSDDLLNFILPYNLLS